MHTFKLKISRGFEVMYFAFGRKEARDEAAKMFRKQGYKVSKSY